MRRLGQLLNLLVITIAAGIAWYEATHPRPKPGESAQPDAEADAEPGASEQSPLDQIVSQVGAVAAQVMERAPSVTQMAERVPGMDQVLERAQSLAGDVRAAAEAVVEQTGVGGRGQADPEPADAAEMSAGNTSEAPPAEWAGAESGVAIEPSSGDFAAATGDEEQHRAGTGERRESPGDFAAATGDEGAATFAFPTTDDGDEPGAASQGAASTAINDIAGTGQDAIAGLSQFDDFAGAAASDAETEASPPMPLDSMTSEWLGEPLPAAGGAPAPAAAAPEPTATTSGPVVPEGAVPGGETGDCPPDYPIKGNASSRIYHEPGRPSYDRTKPEFCFAAVEDAERAGFVPPKSGRS